MALKIATLAKPAVPAKPEPPVIDTADIIAEAIESAQAENAKIIKTLTAELATIKKEMARKRTVISNIERDKAGRIISVTTEMQ